MTRSFVFNGDNRQVEVKDVNGNTIGKYFYDGEGKRVKKITNTETTIFVYSSGKLIAEYSTQLSQTPTTAYTTTDHLGTPRVITNELGQVKARRDFMPFGEDLFINVGARSATLKYGTNEDDIRQKFTGYQKDAETSLDFAEARMYENRFGRFTAIDPLYSSGRSVNPQTFNRYAYAGNNPVLRSDPNGKEWYIAFNYERRNGRIWVKSISPVWHDHSEYYNGRRWGTQGSVVDNGYTRSYNASWVFFDREAQKYTAVDFFEPRQPAEFGSMEAAAKQIDTWNRQAAVNFIAGALSGYSLAFEFAGAAKGMKAEMKSEQFAMGQRAGVGASIATAITGVSATNAIISRFGHGALAILKDIRVTSGALSSFEHAGVFGFGTYKELRSVVGAGTELQVHHLIEKRFAGVMGENASDMMSIVLTKSEHKDFTNAWRQLIPYGTTATRDQVENAAREIYKNQPEILQALNLN